MTQNFPFVRRYSEWYVHSKIYTKIECSVGEQGVCIKILAVPKTRTNWLLANSTACSPHDRKLDLFCEGNFSYKDLEIMFLLLPVSKNADTFVPLIRTCMYIKSPTFSSTKSHIFTLLTLLTHSTALLVFTPQTFGADPEPGAISFPNFLISYTHPHCVLFVDKFGR